MFFLTMKIQIILFVMLAAFCVICDCKSGERKGRRGFGVRRRTATERYDSLTKKSRSNWFPWFGRGTASKFAPYSGLYDSHKNYTALLMKFLKLRIENKQCSLPRISYRTKEQKCFQRQQWSTSDEWLRLSNVLFVFYNGKTSR